MNNTFPPQFVPADFAGLPKPTQEECKGKEEKTPLQRDFANSSQELAREYWEMEPLVLGTDHAAPQGKLDMGTLGYH